MPDNQPDMEKKPPLRKVKDPFLDRTAFGSVGDAAGSVNRSWVHLLRVTCQVLGLWVLAGWMLTNQLFPMPIPPGIQEWLDAWGRWGLGGISYVALPLAVLLIWQGIRPRFFQSLAMLAGAVLLLMPRVIAHLIPGLEVAPLVMVGMVLVAAAQIWPLVERLGVSRYVAPEKE